MLERQMFKNRLFHFLINFTCKIKLINLIRACDWVILLFTQQVKFTKTGTSPKWNAHLNKEREGERNKKGGNEITNGTTTYLFHVCALYFGQYKNSGELRYCGYDMSTRCCKHTLKRFLIGQFVKFFLLINLIIHQTFQSICSETLTTVCRFVRVACSNTLQYASIIIPTHFNTLIRVSKECSCRSSLLGAVFPRDPLSLCTGYDYSIYNRSYSAHKILRS